MVTLAVSCRLFPGVGRPASGSVAGAVILTELAQVDRTVQAKSIGEYPGEHLYDYMNGAAVTYLENGFRTLSTCDVLRAGNQAKVEMYDMGTVAQAGSLYTELSAGSGETLPAGEKGCFWQGFEPEGLFLRGRFLVRVYGYAKDAATGKKLLLDVAQLIDQRLQLRQ